MKKLILMALVAISIVISGCDNQAKQREIEKQRQEDSIRIAENVKKELAEKEDERKRQDAAKRAEWETEDFVTNSDDFEKSISEKAKKGNIEALKDLGMLFLNPYSTGSNLKADEEMAIKLLTKASNKGDVEAQMFLAGEYLGHYGSGKFKNISEGQKWMETAAANGFPDAEFRMGYNYAMGEDGYPQDYTKALEWRKRFAVKGSTPKHVEAQYNVGWQYLKGKGVEKDEFEAMKWFSMAAENGDKEALKILRKYGMAK